MFNGEERRSSVEHMEYSDSTSEVLSLPLRAAGSVSAESGCAGGVDEEGERMEGVCEGKKRREDHWRPRALIDKRHLAHRR
jgi:hypothetical protein